MTIASRILAIALSSCLLFLVLRLIRSRRLKEKYAFLWLFVGSIILILSVFEKILLWVIHLLGIVMPINGMLFLGIFFIIVINLHFSVMISDLSEQNKKIAQKLALLEHHL